jgi:hypothetical protein
MEPQEEGNGEYSGRMERKDYMAKEFCANLALIESFLAFEHSSPIPFLFDLSKNLAPEVFWSQLCRRGLTIPFATQIHSKLAHLFVCFFGIHPLFRFYSPFISPHPFLVQSLLDLSLHFHVPFD